MLLDRSEREQTKRRSLEAEHGDDVAGDTKGKREAEPLDGARSHEEECEGG